MRQEGFSDQTRFGPPALVSGRSSNVKATIIGKVAPRCMQPLSKPITTMLSTSDAVVLAARTVSVVGALVPLGSVVGELVPLGSVVGALVLGMDALVLRVGVVGTSVGVVGMSVGIEVGMSVGIEVGVVGTFVGIAVGIEVGR